MQTPIPFKNLKQRTHFFFLRHGESEGNRRHMIQGHVDMPLTDLGREHAAAAGQYFSEYGIDAMLASPLSRAWETATIVAKATGMHEHLSPCDDLVELNTGIFSGMAVDDIQKQYAAEWSRFQQESWEAVPEAESIEELKTRALRVWSKMIDVANEGNTRVLSVSHGGTIQWLFKMSFGDSWNSWMPLVRTSNCGIYHLMVTPVSLDSDSSGPGYISEWLRLNHIPY